MTSEEPGVKEKIRAEYHLFILSWSPTASPQCQVNREEWRNSIKRGTTGGLLPSLFAESRHLQTLGLDHQRKSEGSNVSQEKNFRLC